MTKENQLDLFERAPFQPHSETSIAAAVAIEPGMSLLQARVLGYLEHRGHLGATDEEIQTALALNPSTERPRRIELVTRLAVIDTGLRRRTHSGRNAVVWAIRTGDARHDVTQRLTRSTAPDARAADRRSRLSRPVFRRVD